MIVNGNFGPFFDLITLLLTLNTFVLSLKVRQTEVPYSPSATTPKASLLLIWIYELNVEFKLSFCFVKIAEQFENKKCKEKRLRNDQGSCNGRRVFFLLLANRLGIRCSRLR